MRTVPCSTGSQWGSSTGGATLSGAVVPQDGTYSWSPTLTKMFKGTVNGTAYLRDHPVISRVVGKLLNGSFSQEYVELYNPSTFTWTLSGNVGLKYTNRSYDAAKDMVRKIIKEDPVVQRVLGANPDIVIAKIFV